MPAAPTQPDSLVITVSVEASPEDAFAAILDVRGWWSENIEGRTDRPGQEFTYHHRDVHRCTIRVTEVTDPTKVAWHVVDSHFHLTDDCTEWTGTEIHFDVSRTTTGSEVRFTHVGLVPACECFDVCSNAWDFYLRTSLRGLIRTGKGLPNPAEHPAA